MFLFQEKQGMSFLVALNNNCMGFLVALITHSMEKFIALRGDNLFKKTPSSDNQQLKN